MRKAHLVVAALALAVSGSASAQAETLHRRHVRTSARRAVPPPPAPVPSVGTGLAAPDYDQVGSAIDRTTSAIARASAASRAITTDAFGPILRTIYPSGNSGSL